LRTVFLVSLIFLAVASSASAAPFVVGSGELPDVAVDAAGTAYLTWKGTEPGNPAHYCRLPRGATACDIALTLPLPAGALGSTTRPIVALSAGRVSVLHYTSGQTAQVTRYMSTDGGATFPSIRVTGTLPPYASVVGPGDSVSIVTHADGRGTLFQNMPLDSSTAAFATFEPTRQYYGAVGLEGAHGRGEAVAAARQRFDVLAAVGPLAERLPEQRHVDGEVRLLDEGVGPHPAHQLFFGDHAAVVFDQRQEDAENFRRQRHRLARTQ